MIRSHSTAIRMLTSLVAVLLAIAVLVARGSFSTFLIGVAFGLCLGLLALVWSKNALHDDRTEDGKPVELEIAK